MDKSPYRPQWDGTNAGTTAVLPVGVTQKGNDNGAVTASPIGTKKELLPVPAGEGIGLWIW